MKKPPFETRITFTIPNWPAMSMKTIQFSNPQFKSQQVRMTKLKSPVLYYLKTSWERVGFSLLNKKWMTM